MALLDGRAAVVTGAAQGIGREITRVFAAHGARVLIADLDEDAAIRAAGQITDGGGTASAVRADVTDPEEVSAAVRTCVDRYGSLDVMVNNAGITRDATMRKMTLADFSTVVDVHLTGTWLGTQAASLIMREQGHGSIVNISSISGKVGMIGQTNYSAAKAGIVGLTKAAAKEIAHLGVRVNAVQPGLIRTAMTDALRPDVWQQKLDEIPMGRAGESEEVANVVLFLAGDLSSYMTGTVLEITGGRHL